MSARTDAWASAVTHMEQAEAEYARVASGYSAAIAAADADCPPTDEYWKRYGLNAGRSRDELYRTAHMSLCIERATGPNRSDEDVEALGRDANSVVDEFLSYQERREQAMRLHDIDAWEDRHDTACDRRHDAREAVLRTDAPDEAALLVKFDILTDMMDGEDSQARVVQLRADARRLIGKGA